MDLYVFGPKYEADNASLVDPIASKADLKQEYSLEWDQVSSKYSQL